MMEPNTVQREFVDTQDESIQPATVRARIHGDPKNTGKPRKAQTIPLVAVTVVCANKAMHLITELCLHRFASGNFCCGRVMSFWRRCADRCPLLHVIAPCIVLKYYNG